MVWDEKLKREIPEGWHCGNLFEIAVFTNGLACQKFRPKPGEKPLPVIKIREMHDGISSDPEEVSPNIPESVKVYNGDVLFSWSASLEVMVWAYGLGGLNQHIFKVTSANGFPKSFYYFQLLNYVDVFKKMAEARKTTMGHITQDHLQQSTIPIPNDKDIAYKFEKRVSPILTGTVKQQEVISILTKLRDSLLPLLMNGQVSINYDLASIISQLHDVKKANFANHRGRQVTKFVYICARETCARERRWNFAEKAAHFLSKIVRFSAQVVELSPPLGAEPLPPQQRAPDLRPSRHLTARQPAAHALFIYRAHAVKDSGTRHYK